MKSMIILSVIAVIIAIVLFLQQDVEAKSSPEFVDYLTSMISKSS